MGWRSRLAAWLDPSRREVARAFAPPQYRMATFRQGIVNTENQPTPDALMVDAFRGMQAVAARAVARRVGDLELMVTQRVPTPRGAPDFIEIPNHPLAPLLARPNPLLTRLQLLRLISYWLTQSGEAYLLKVTNGAGAVRELWPMSPRNVEKVSGDARPVDAFVFHGERGEERFRVDEVVWIYDPDPAYPFQGVGVVGPHAREIDATTFASATLREHFQHDATPKTVLQAKEDARLPEPDQRKEFEADWLNRYDRLTGTARNTPAFLPSGFDLRELGQGMPIEEVRAFLEFQRDQLLMANGVPRSILGDVVDANRAAAETNQFVFDLHTVSPQAGLIADALTYQLAQPEHGESVFVRFREFVAEDREFRLREETADLIGKVRTVDEVRAARGMDPATWGALPVGTMADVPYDGSAPEPTDPLGPQPGEGPGDAQDGQDDEGQDDQGDPNDAPAGRSRAHPGAQWTPAAEWSRVMQRDREFVPLMVSRLRRYFAAQRGAVLAALPTLQRAFDPDAWSRADELDELLAGGDLRRLFDLLVTPVSIDAAAASRANALRLLGAKPSLAFTDRAVAYLKDRGAELVTNVNRTTKTKLAKTLAKGTAEGESLQQLTARVRKVFSEAVDHRARTIARTEVLQAVQFGQLEGYRDSGRVVGKRWNTAQDDRVRDSHLIDGQAVELRGTFELDGELADGPGLGAGGTRLSARNAINCRCFLTPVLEGDL